ncbi:hypothetical protein VQ042_00360 [Aurantimonas sp. A2-1-M11]|uniref:hypothetical protein n=1 Tax=Aurantimonas sp. A2-1-M11 TaxID=3113712 RepID=UPI002F934DF5
MITLRRFLADRSAALAAMLILTQLLVGQAAASAFSCARMDASVAAGMTVICVGDSFETRTAGAGENGDHDCCTDCPCAAGCGHGAALPVPAAGGSYAIAVPMAGHVTAWPTRIDAMGPRAPPRGLALQRGPPSHSV